MRLVPVTFFFAKCTYTHTHTEQTLAVCRPYTHSMCRLEAMAFIFSCFVAIQRLRWCRFVNLQNPDRLHFQNFVATKFGSLASLVSKISGFLCDIDLLLSFHVWNGIHRWTDLTSAYPLAATRRCGVDERGKRSSQFASTKIVNGARKSRNMFKQIIIDLGMIFRSSWFIATHLQQTASDKLIYEILFIYSIVTGRSFANLRY